MLDGKCNSYCMQKINMGKYVTDCEKVVINSRWWIMKFTYMYNVFIEYSHVSTRNLKYSFFHIVVIP